jgi:IclR family acetate operon transcriptional repressor
MTSLDKAIDLLIAVADRPGAAGNLELSRATGIDKSTSHRLLATLERRGLVRRDTATRGYRLGPGLIELALGNLVHPTLVARPLLQRLADQAHESAWLSLVVDETYVPVDAVHAPHELRFAPDVGRRYPLNAGAAGKAILAFRPELVARLRDHLPRLTANTIASAAELDAELRRIRAAGYATSEGERALGGCSIAAPVLGRDGRSIGALSISSVCARCDRECLVRHADAVRAAAAELSELLSA